MENREDKWFKIVGSLFLILSIWFAFLGELDNARYFTQTGFILLIYAKVLNFN